jgi:hypothetical protein
MGCGWSDPISEKGHGIEEVLAGGKCSSRALPPEELTTHDPAEDATIAEVSEPSAPVRNPLQLSYSSGGGSVAVQPAAGPSAKEAKICIPVKQCVLDESLQSVGELDARCRRELALEPSGPNSLIPDASAPTRPKPHPVRSPSDDSLPSSIKSTESERNRVASFIYPTDGPSRQPSPPDVFMELVTPIGPTSDELWAQLGMDVMMLQARVRERQRELDGSMMSTLSLLSEGPEAAAAFSGHAARGRGASARSPRQRGPRPQSHGESLESSRASSLQERQESEGYQSYQHSRREFVDEFSRSAADSHLGFSHLWEEADNLSSLSAVPPSGAGAPSAPNSSAQSRRLASSFSSGNLQSDAALKSAERSLQSLASTSS